MPARYQIRVRGQLDPTWSAWFAGLTITHEPSGDTVFAGPLPDQAALYGVLEKARNLNLTLLSVRELPPMLSDTDPPDDVTRTGPTDGGPCTPTADPRPRIPYPTDGTVSHER